MSADEDTEKEHEPTQRKLDEARRKGEVPRSVDLITAASYGGLLLIAVAWGGGSISLFGSELVAYLDRPERMAPMVFGDMATAPAGSFLFGALLPLAPWFVVPGLLALAAIVVQRSFVLAPDKVKPKLSRISPISNAKNKFGRSGLFEFAKSFAKLFIFAVILGFFLSARMPGILNAARLPPGPVSALLGSYALDFLSLVLVISLVIGGIDALWQYNEHMRKNRMSRKELMDEMKSSEGDPAMKQKRRQKGQEIATNRMLADVPNADVVIVNPTHFAVALSWSRDAGAAPVCVAKGVDETAARIREVAHQNGVPIRHDPPTARALHATVEIGQEIAPDQYRAVAAAIRFAEAMRRKSRWTRS